MDTFDIAGSALTAQRLRLDVIASNLANVNTTRKTNGELGTYHRRNVVFSSLLNQAMNAFQSPSSAAASVPFGKGGPGGSHANWINHGGSNSPYFKLSATEINEDATAQGVKVSQIVEDTNTPDRLVYDPSHPDADQDGYVHMPNINPITEMVDMIAASRAYEANVNSITTSKAMSSAALEI